MAQDKLALEIDPAVKDEELTRRLAQPLCNLVLRLNRFGRLALSREETSTANFVGVCVLTALTLVAAFFAADNFGWLIGALGCMFLIPPFTAIYYSQPGTPRRLAVLLTVAMAVSGFFRSAPMILMDVLPESLILAVLPLILLCIQVFPIAAFVSQFAANALTTIQPRY